MTRWLCFTFHLTTETFSDWLDQKGQRNMQISLCTCVYVCVPMLLPRRLLSPRLVFVSVSNPLSDRGARGLLEGLGAKCRRTLATHCFKRLASTITDARLLTCTRSFEIASENACTCLLTCMCWRGRWRTLSAPWRSCISEPVPRIGVGSN